MLQSPRARIGLLVILFLAVIVAPVSSENWLQLKFDSRHSGNVPGRDVKVPLGLVGAVPLTDAVFTAPVVAEGRVFVVDGSGVAFAIDAATLRVLWRRQTRGGKANCNNVSSPAVAGRYLHFGTMAGSYYVLDTISGEIVREIRCDEPILSAPVVSGDRVYFATLGSRVHAIKPDGSPCWTWDFVKEEMQFEGDRWSGEDWLKQKQGKVTRNDQFLCSRDLAVFGKWVVVPAGDSIVWLEDTGTRAMRRALYVHPQTPATLALSLGEDGAVYRQWHWLDNTGQVDIYRLRGGEVRTTVVPGTQTNSRFGSLSFSSVSVRGPDVYRTRPEEGFGFCKHSPDRDGAHPLGGYPSVASPILLRDSAVFGGLDGKLYIIPLSNKAEAGSFKTAFGKAISAPACVCNGRIYFGCEDGYLYALGPGGNSPLPTKDLKLERTRSPLTSKLASAQYNRFTSFHDWSNANCDEQALRLPVKLKWIRRYEGTVKHFSTFGGGRMYTHTAEGQIFAVEQETGRLLWRVFSPGVHICYTSPLYHDERLLVPQAGEEKCRLRCLDAATGKLIWEAPFAGSPSWNRQLPPVVHKNVAIYMFGTGTYGPDQPLKPGEPRKNWLFGHQDNARFPQHHKPILRAYDLQTGRTVWEKDFSEYGAGGDEAGVCLMDDVLYYTCFFGHSAMRRGQPGPKGLTSAIEPATGKIIWLTTEHWMNGGCTISAQDGRLYLGGYNRVGGTNHRYVWCLDARDGSLIWRSEPVLEAIQVVTIGPRFLFVHAQYKQGYLLDKKTGKILTTLTEGYKCTRFALSEPFLIGSNMDLIDLSDVHSIKLVSTGPRVDPSECVSAVVSGGRLFYTGHGGGLQVSQVYGAETKNRSAPWEADRSSAEE
ncbi:MAG: PQQ-binding-like beta-propeller repeat protein [Pirellulales bacterium]